MDSALDLATAVRVRSWSWLFEIGASLRVDVRIVDLRTAPVLSPPSEPALAILHDQEFVAAVGRAQRAQSVESAQIGQTAIACVVLRIAASDVGVLAISRRVPSKKSPKTEEWPLEEIAAVLRPAIEAHLESAGPSVEEAQRLTALRRALADYEETSELDVVRVFGTAISIWEDLDVHAYHEVVGGEYVQLWAPAGAADEPIPAALSLPMTMRARELTHVSVQSADSLGIAAASDLVMAHLPLEGSQWLLLFTRVADREGVNRLSLYVDILEQSLKQMAVHTTFELSRRVWDALLEAAEDPARSAEAATGEIVRALGGDFGCLIVTAPDGSRLVAAGSTDRFANLAASSAPTQLAVARRLERGGTMLLGVGRDADRAAFSSGERHLLESIADMVDSWAAGIVRRPATAGERRSTARPFQQVVEEVVENTVRSGGSVSVIVIRLGGEFRAGVAHRLAAQIRSHLRAAEPAGALTEGEIAAVLFDANRDQARAVVTRLRELGPTLADGEALSSAAVGVAHWAAGTVPDTPLIVAARQDALRSVNDASARGRIQ